MYEIIINGQVVSTVTLPNYIKYRSDLQSWVVCDEPEAEAILVPVEREEEHEELYCNLAGKPVANPDWPTAEVRAVEA